jgi:flagellar biosynthetic protein FliO
LGADLAANAIKTAGSLLLVLGLIICLFYFLKKMRFGSSSTPGAARLRLISSLSVAPKRSVALLELRDQWLVVGIGTESVTLLSQMNRPDDINEAIMDESEKTRSFGSLLKNKMGLVNTKNDPQ